MQCLSSKSCYMIVVAGGKGLRFGSEIPKQFLPIGGKPILIRTIEKIKQAISDINIILVLPKEYKDYWQLLISEYGFSIEHKIVDSGDERFFSVKNGIDAIEDENAIIGVHDGVRPFVGLEVVRECMLVAEKLGIAIPAIKPVETVRLGRTENSAHKSSSFDRNEVFLVQTPQCFDAKILKKAYSQSFDKSFTDDASVVEKLGYGINLVKGNRENIKITTPLDIVYAEILIDEFKD
ncbi:MAG: 2-C-methyl-D-erythritol 4-phosphate cytidylyltransferase [Bacteroidales bacterium]|nr:2-C-methyl-D-erythritol 4-phosphate cytidylyltransferase [Bacteroidales bacterium]